MEEIFVKIQYRIVTYQGQFTSGYDGDVNFTVELLEGAQETNSFRSAPFDDISNNFLVEGSLWYNSNENPESYSGLKKFRQNN